MSTELFGSLIPAGTAFIGLIVGGYFTAHNQKRERQQQRICNQLGEFYGPMLALRACVQKVNFA